MEIIDIQSSLIKWEPNEGTFDSLVKTGERQEFLLFKHTPIYKSVFNIKGIFYVTCPDTDFILDVEIKSEAEFDCKGKPSLDELYNVYVNTRVRWLGLILSESSKNGFTLWIQSPPAPFEHLSVHLKKALDQAYPY